MTKEELAKAIVYTYSSGFFYSKKHHEAIAGLLFRLILDDDPNPICYLSQFDLDTYSQTLTLEN